MECGPPDPLCDKGRGEGGDDEGMWVVMGDDVAMMHDEGGVSWMMWMMWGDTHARIFFIKGYS